MKTTVLKLASLRRPEKNVRMHSTKQLIEFRRSIEMFGQIRPIVVDEDGTILAGNGLYEALLSMNREEADCYVVSNLTVQEKKKLMLADNRVFSLGVDDLSVFDEIIAELGTDLDIPGYDPNLLQSLVAEVGDVDELIGGYGMITDADKASMARASERYSQEEQSFAEEAEEVVLQNTHQAASVAHPVNGTQSDVVDTTQQKTSQETPPVPLQRKYLICPKCGEKIWL